jgi:endonuclease-3 related protein
MKPEISAFYKKLYSYFGPQYWWPAGSSFEVMLGAILTQNTSWSNVEKAIANLKKHKLLELSKLYRLSHRRLASLIRSAGYYNIKARRLKEFLKFLHDCYEDKIENMSGEGTLKLRKRLLSVKGIGQETADSILLYALNKPIFVVDSYTKRILLRHNLIEENFGYEEVQNLFMQNLRNSVKLFNEYHALLVRLGKEFCLKNRPRCKECPLNAEF